MSKELPSSKREYCDIAAAPFWIIGIIWTLSGIFLFLLGQFMNDMFPKDHSLVTYLLSVGIGSLVVGTGIIKRWKYIWIPSATLCIFGLLSFPIGTLLCGWAIYSLWKLRFDFFPFKRDQKNG